MKNLQISYLKQRFSTLPANDRLALIGLGLFLAALMVIYMLILPAQRFANAAADHYQQRAELLAWMQANEQAARAIASEPSEQSSVPEGQSILSLASQHAQANNISFKRFEPVTDSGLRIWLENIPFNNMLQWLTQLQNDYGIKVIEISIDRGERPGKVTAKLELFLPS